MLPAAARWLEAISLPVVLATRALPEFWLGMVLLAVFSFSFGLLPAGGATSPGASFPNAFARYVSLDFLHHLVLPSLTLAIFLQGLPMLLMRSNMLEVMQEEFVVMSRIKGLSEWSIIIRHAARNALLPVATALALGHRLIDRRQRRDRKRVQLARPGPASGRGSVGQRLSAGTRRVPDDRGSTGRHELRC